MPRRRRGFTLVELTLVIVIGGVLAATLTVFLRPAVESYIAQRDRATLQGAAQAALQAISRDVRGAVPNSLRTPGEACFELLPTVGGGRYRLGPDPSNDTPGCATASACAAWVDTSSATTAFDVIGPLNGSVAVGDHIVIGNLRTEDGYAGDSRATVTALAASPQPAFGTQRISVSARQFPAGYDGGRFYVVPGSEGAVSYSCVGAGVDAKGDGTGRLLRRSGYGFVAAYPSSCPTSGEVVATRVQDCSFEYRPDALAGYGIVSLRLVLSRNGERSTAQSDVMVSNLP